MIFIDLGLREPEGGRKAEGAKALEDLGLDCLPWEGFPFGSSRGLVWADQAEGLLVGRQLHSAEEP